MGSVLQISATVGHLAIKPAFFGTHELQLCMYTDPWPYLVPFNSVHTIGGHKSFSEHAKRIKIRLWNWSLPWKLQQGPTSAIKLQPARCIETRHRFIRLRQKPVYREDST